jgi:hypothetical protein
MVVAVMKERKPRVQNFSQRDVSALLNALDAITQELIVTREKMVASKIPFVEFDGPGRAARAINSLSDFSADLESAVKKHGKRM